MNNNLIPGQKERLQNKHSSGQRINNANFNHLSFIYNIFAAK